MSPLQRALGAFYGLALGDALGMPTQSLSQEQIHQRFGVIRTLEDAGPEQPIAANMPAGSITDDTEQAILVGRLLVQGQGRIDPAALARSLIQWEAAMQAKGSQDLLGPSTKRAIEMILAGESVEEAGRYGTTNGAAMRITPVGIATDVASAQGFVQAVVEACQVTHNTSLGIASAAAVAAVVSAGINGASLIDALPLGAQIARQAQAHGHWVAGATIAARLEWAGTLGVAGDKPAFARMLYELIAPRWPPKSRWWSVSPWPGKLPWGTLRPSRRCAWPPGWAATPTPSRRCSGPCWAPAWACRPGPRS